MSINICPWCCSTRQSEPGYRWDLGVDCNHRFHDPPKVEAVVAVADPATQLRRDLRMVIDFWMMPHVDYRLMDAIREDGKDLDKCADNIIDMLKEKGVL